MFWVFAVWIGVVVVGSMIFSTATTGSPVPGEWGRTSPRRRTHGGTHRVAHAGRTP